MVCHFTAVHFKYMCKDMKTSQVQHWFAWGQHDYYSSKKHMCCSKFKLHCRNMKEGEHGNCLTSFLIHWTKKTAVKKLNKVSRRSAFGNSSLHTAPCQNTEQSASGSTLQCTTSIQLHRNLNSAHGWNFPFSVSTILKVFPKMKHV